MKALAKVTAIVFLLGGFVACANDFDALFAGAETDDRADGGKPDPDGDDDDGVGPDGSAGPGKPIDPTLACGTPDPKCTFAQGGDTTRKLSCDGCGCSCSPFVCSDAVTCTTTCTGGATCSGTCLFGECTFTVSGSRGEYDCGSGFGGDGAAVCTLSCTDGASCGFDCSDAKKCQVDCEGSQCNVFLCENDGCRLDGCANRQPCPDGSISCGGASCEKK